MHTCALTTAGTVLCWGYNDQGQLGTGDRVARLAPTSVPGIGGSVQSIDAGFRHTCVLLSGGAIRCWGWNDVGQLGDGTTTTRMTPTDVIGLPRAARAVAAGPWTTCALLDDGSVYCWGRNDDGQLGDGTTTQRTRPVRVALPGSATAIAAGHSHICALDQDGAVSCWGSNTYGQVGDGTTTRRLTPVPVAGVFSGVHAIHAGIHHTCAVTMAGRVLCWGYNEYGQLGDGATAHRSAPVLLSGPSGVTQLATGYFYTCALHAGGA
ncbi:MAG: RCC1 repeat-containing protein, partial [Chloroflexi bacterium]|nr:RCC1 repeat-containing protein [Chloroflexota bacterium]